jgi:hypothetical protein
MEATLKAEPGPENHLRLEIGYVLFLDLVGYSKLLIEEQKERILRCSSESSTRKSTFRSCQRGHAKYRHARQYQIFDRMRVEQRANTQQRIRFSHDTSPQTWVQLHAPPFFIALASPRFENKTAWPGVRIQSLNTAPKLQRPSMVCYWSMAERDFADDFRCTIHPVAFHLFSSLAL